MTVQTYASAIINEEVHHRLVLIVQVVLSIINNWDFIDGKGQVSGVTIRHVSRCQCADCSADCCADDRHLRLNWRQTEDIQSCTARV